MACERFHAVMIRMLMEIEDVQQVISTCQWKLMGTIQLKISGNQAYIPPHIIFQLHHIKPRTLNVLYQQFQSDNRRKHSFQES